MSTEVAADALLPAVRREPRRRLEVEPMLEPITASSREESEPVAEPMLEPER